MNAKTQSKLTNAYSQRPPTARELMHARDEVYDPQASPTTEPGELAPQREQRQPAGAGIVWVVVCAIGAFAASFIVVLGLGALR